MKNTEKDMMYHTRYFFFRETALKFSTTLTSLILPKLFFYLALHFLQNVDNITV